MARTGLHMSDDYWERRQESNAFWDREYDQRAREDELAARSARFYGALLSHDHGRARWELGLPPSDESVSRADGPRRIDIETAADRLLHDPGRPRRIDVDGRARAERSQTPTAEEQFEEHRRKLLAILNVALCLPASVLTRWAAAVRTIDSVESGLRTIAALQGECSRLKQENTRRRGYSTDPCFDNEIWDVEAELAWLERILHHVQEYLRGGGTGSFALSPISDTSSR
jgi:hypothetical protein